VAVVVLGVTGCIGAYKACEVLRELQRRGHDVHVVMTSAATHFVTPMTFEALSGHSVFVDQFALGENGEIRHVGLADAAELLLVAPCTANTLGRFANGLAADALSTLYTATRAPVLVAPAMNVQMLHHPAVVANLETLRARGVGIVEPGRGYLACGWLGEGRLADVADIVAAAETRLGRSHDLAGERVLVTAGPTVEDIDPVRFVSNRSSGRMGVCLAEAARDRGASVVLVTGPTSLAEPGGMEVVHVRSAADMAHAVEAQLPQTSMVAMAAAVSDYRPADKAPQKLKKKAGPERLDLVRTTDILASVGKRKGRRFVVGFAAETEGLEREARRKLRDKKLDLVVANDVSQPGIGFGSPNNAATLIDAKGGEIEVPVVSKRELAERIWDRVRELRPAKQGRRATRSRKSRS
jgi:phosphopantothenoylcysteine decarboxylase/phosphopantothenate--cysteine ligase